jgi:hypothetical protein
MQRNQHLSGKHLSINITKLKGGLGVLVMTLGLLKAIS